LLKLETVEASAVMKEVVNSMPSYHDEGAQTVSFRQERSEDIADLKLLTFQLELHSLQALLTVLTTVARLGCRIAHVHTVASQADLGVLAPIHIAHRVRGCLGQLIEVLAVSETTR
jgi:hypothetical protein